MTALTRVRLAFVADRLNQWLRFGKPLIEDLPDPHYRHVYFAPGAVFGLVDWRANDYGTVRWRLSILRTAGPGERMACFADIEPGAQLLLHAATPGKTRRVLQLIDAIEAQCITLEEVSEDYWRVLHQRLITGIDPPVYSAAEHTAMWQRRELLP